MTALLPIWAGMHDSDIDGTAPSFGQPGDDATAKHWFNLL